MNITAKSMVKEEKKTEEEKVEEEKVEEEKTEEEMKESQSEVGTLGRKSMIQYSEYRKMKSVTEDQFYLKYELTRLI